MSVHTEEFAKELSVLYEKAKTKEEYEEVIERGIGVKTELVGEFPDITASVISSYYWAKYYRYLKFSSSRRDRVDLLDEVGQMFSQVKDPDNRVALLYLESVILSNLLNDQKGAEWRIFAIGKIIAEEEVSITSTLRWINSRVVKEMAEKNWSEAVEISEEIERFPGAVLRQPENLRHAANIFSNRGASYIRGDIDVDEGRKNLLIAKGLYLQEEVRSETHLEGIRNRLREADEKS